MKLRVCLVLICLINLNFALSEGLTFLSQIDKVATAENLETDDDSFIEFNREALIQGAKDLLENVESSITEAFSISEACKSELVSLKSVIDVIKKSSSSEEIIFYSAKDIVNHFPGLRQNCGIPLPDIKTDNWDFEKFKKYKCALTAVKFAANAATCIEGGFWACAKTLKDLYSLAVCIKNLI